MTQLALRSQKAPSSETASLVILLMLAELEVRWKQPRKTAGLADPKRNPGPGAVGSGGAGAAFYAFSPSGSFA